MIACLYGPICLFISGDMSLNADKYFMILMLLIFPVEFFLLPSKGGWITLRKCSSKHELLLLWSDCTPPIYCFLIMPQTFSAIPGSPMISCLAHFFPVMWLTGQRTPFCVSLLEFFYQYYSSLCWLICYQAFRIFLSCMVFYMSI